MSEHPSLFGEKYLYGISPHLASCPTSGQKREATPDDSILATPVGIRIARSIQTLATYADSQRKEKRGLFNKIATDLLLEATNIPFFYDCISNEHILNPQLRTTSEELRAELTKSYRESAMKQDPLKLTKAQLLSAYKLAHLDSEYCEVGSEIMSGFLLSSVHPNLRKKGRDEIKAGLERGTISQGHLQYSQDRIVHLMYNLTTAVLESHDEELLKALGKTLTFQTQELNTTLPYSDLYTCSGMSENDETLAKFTHVDFTAMLLNKKYSSGVEFENIMKNLIQTSPVAQYYIHHVENNHSRYGQLTDYYETRYSLLGEQISADVKNVGEYFTRTLPFPENIIYAQGDLWYLYLEYFAKYALEKDIVKSPVISLSLPDRTVRPITLQEGDSGAAAKEVMQYASWLGEPATITDKYVVESFLNHLKPELQVPVCARLQVDNAVKRKELTSSPKHSIPQIGMYVAIDQQKYSDIAASRLFVDRSASRINIVIGNKTLSLQLDDNYLLCTADGTPLQITPTARIWWDHVILPQLYQYICRAPEDNEGYVDGINIEEGESAGQATRRLLSKRVGHLRTLGITTSGKSKHHTLEQRMRTLEVEFPLPKIKWLDLDKHNAGRPDGEKQTYVLPIERELKEPPTFHLPHAYDDTKNAF